MNFQPETIVRFCRTGITSNFKVWCRTEEDKFNVMTSGGEVMGVMDHCSFQRADGHFIVRVDHEQIAYYSLLQCDSLIYKNDEQYASFWIIGSITSVEWRNESCSFVHFDIDPFMTYSPMIDWDKTYAYVVREHVKEDWSSSNNPMFSNIGPAEDFNVLADVPIWRWNKNYKLDTVLIYSPYDDSGKPKFNGSVENGLYTSLYTDSYPASHANTYFHRIAESKDASINNIVGVYGYPNEFAGALYGTLGDYTEDLKAVNIAAKENPNVPEYNNSKCWSAPYCIIRLMASNGSVVDFTPQWFGNDINAYTFLARVRTCGKQFGGLAGTFKNKNGIFDWKTWNDFTVLLDELPRCPWTADGFTDWMSYNRSSIIANVLLSAGRTVANSAVPALAAAASKGKSLSGGSSAVAGYYNTELAKGVVKDVADFGQTIIDIGTQIAQHKATGATTQGSGNYSSLFDIAQEAWGFKVLYYMAQPYLMKTIDAYFDRFGYRVNKLKKLEPETRPIWNFIQTAECHVAIKTGMPITAEQQINKMFNSGVTIWNKDKYLSGRKIGDFSDPDQNRGIQGG